MSLTHAILLAFAPGIIALLYKVIKNASGVSRIYHSHADLVISVIKHDDINQEILIKIAYSGHSPLIIKGLKLTSVLSLSNFREGFRAWFQLIRGFFSNDWEGLQNVLGEKYRRREPVWLMSTLNYIQGFFLSLLTITLLYNPFGWVFLFIGPYSSLKIISEGNNIDIYKKDTNENKILPFLINSACEAEFYIRYTLLVKSKNFPSIHAKHIIDMPDRPLWKLPRFGQLILKGKLKLLVKTSGILTAHRINLGMKDFVLIPQ